MHYFISLSLSLLLFFIYTWVASACNNIKKKSYVFFVFHAAEVLLTDEYYINENFNQQLKEIAASPGVKNDIYDDFDESNNYDNKNLYFNHDPNNNNNNRIKNKSSGEYYVVNFSVNDETNASTSSSTKSRLFNRRKSSEVVEVKIEKKLSVPNIQQPATKFKHITDHLIAFFKKRPSADQLKQRGILQGTF
jgi:hypothetical protein